MRFLIQLILLIIIVSISNAQTNYFVNASTGNDITGNGNEGSPWATVEHAVNNVANTSTDIIIINVADGIYDLSNNQIDISRGFTNLTILGQSTVNTVIQSASDTSLATRRVFKIYAGNKVKLKKMTIKNGAANNDGDGYSYGGGIFNKSGNLTIESCKVTENVSGSTGKGYGAGICNFNGGTLVISNSTISHNRSAYSTTLQFYGGGVASINGTLTIVNSTISNNSTPGAGGIAIIADNSLLQTTSFDITNSTVSENNGYYDFGGIRISNWDFLNAMNININSCTIFKNSASHSYGGIGIVSLATTFIRNSIVAGNTSQGTPDDLQGTNVVLPRYKITSGGFNIFQTAPTNITIEGEQNNGIGLNPDLLLLADNNSKNGTQTCATQIGSPAIDLIPIDLINGAPALDQRGFQRDGNYDIGSYEYTNISLVNNDISKFSSFTLDQNYPNPFNPSTKIHYTIPSITLNKIEESFVTLKVYDILGNEVAVLVNEQKSAGSYEVDFNALGLSSGIYFYKLQAGQGFIETKKMILMK